VLEAVRASLAADPDLLILLCGHNEFLDRASEAASRRALAFGLAHAASVRWLAAAQRALAPRRRALDPAAERIEPYDRGSPDFARRVARYEANLDAVARLAHARGIPLVLATVPANLADWPPVHRQLEVEPGRAREIDAVEAALAGGRLDEADARLAAALGVHPEDAMLLFLRGKLEQRRGALDAARRSFERARELDPYPWRVLGRFNEIVRQRARANAAILADVEAALAAAAAGGLVGFELIADNAHPTPLGAALMARTILLALARHGILVGPGPALPPAPEQLERYLASLGDAAERRRLYALQQLRSGVYAMKPPFFHYAIARSYFEAAQALAPDDWRIPANQASLLLLEGRGEEARAALARVLALGGSLADEDPDVPYLRIALERSGGAGTAR
jgi:tetratricopeptide (TPR) repeat protein